MVTFADTLLFYLLRKLKKKGKCISLNELKSEIKASTDVFLNALNTLMKENAIYLGLNNKVCIKNPVEIVQLLVKAGYSVAELSKYIDWKDFEEFTAQVLKMANLIVYRNLRVPPPKGFEIDVLGLNLINNVAYVIDCKHWSKSISLSGKLSVLTQEHFNRTIKLNEKCEWLLGKIHSFTKVKLFIPVVITLYPVNVKVFNNVFVVPIQTLNDFIINTEYYVDTFKPKLILNRCKITS